MVDSVNQRYSREFSQQVHVAAQQMQSRLSPYVKTKALSADDFAYDGIESVEATEIEGRNTKTVFSDITHTRRQLKARRFHVALPVDPNDMERVVSDVTNNYADAVVAAIMRKKDRVIIEEMFADVRTGKDFADTVSFVNDGGETIDATAGLTYEKLLEMNRVFTNNEVGNEMAESFVLGITGDEEEQLFSETELTSGDFTRNFAVEKGSIVNAVGFDLVKYGASVENPVINVNDGTRDCFAMSTSNKPAMCFGIQKDIDIKITERPDLNYTTQVYADIIIGAVRTEGVLIQKVQTTEIP